MSINPIDATMMIAPRATVGSGASSGVKKEQEDDGERGGDKPDPLRFTAHLIVDGRARGAERGRKAGQETRADIGHAEGHEFLVGIDLLTVSAPQRRARSGFRRRRSGW